MLILVIHNNEVRSATPALITSRLPDGFPSLALNSGYPDLQGEEKFLFVVERVFSICTVLPIPSDYEKAGKYSLAPV